MVKELNIKIDNRLLALIDKRRGDLSRDDFLEYILKEHLDSSKDGPMNFEKLKKGLKDKDSGENVVLKAGDVVKLIDDFQDFANNIYNRIDRLEEIIETNNISLKNMESSTFQLKDKITNEDFKVNETEQDYDNNTENVIFEILDESDSDGKTNPNVGSDYFELDEPVDSNGANVSKTPNTMNNSDVLENSEFEYGCPFCNATISENADQCPNCGRQFDDFGVDDREYVEVTPLSVGYDDTGRYDPRPAYLKNRVGRYPQKPQSVNVQQVHIPSEDPYNAKHNMNLAAKNQPPPLCEVCGGKLSYVEDFSRWYCHRCKKYSGGPPPDVKPDFYSVRKVQPEHSLKKASAPGHGPEISKNARGGVPVYTHDPNSDRYEHEHVPQRPVKPNVAGKRRINKDPNWRPLKDYRKENE